MIPNKAPLKKIFSLPVASGSIPSEISIREATLPRIITLPLVGGYTPDIALKKVLLPAPLGPIIPNLSPFFNSKFKKRDEVLKEVNKLRRTSQGNLSKLQANDPSLHNRTWMSGFFVLIAWIYPHRASRAGG